MTYNTFHHCYTKPPASKQSDTLSALIVQQVTLIRLGALSLAHIRNANMVFGAEDSVTISDCNIHNPNFFLIAIQNLQLQSKVTHSRL